MYGRSVRSQTYGSATIAASRVIRVQSVARGFATTAKRRDILGRNAPIRQSAITVAKSATWAGIVPRN